MRFARAVRRQPPVHSPLDGPALGRAAAALFVGPDPRDSLISRLRRLYPASTIVLTDSGTSALQWALGILLPGVRAGDCVALPAYSCFDLATAAIGAGARVVLYDLDPYTLAPDLPTLERCFTEGARVVVIAPLYGIPVEWDDLAGLAADHGALLLEDAAQGHGAEWAGARLGTLSDFGVLSFGRGKGWTGGRGGAVLMRRPRNGAFPVPDLAPRTATELADLVRAAAQWALGRPSCYALPAMLPGAHLGETRYHPPRPVGPMPRGAAMLLERTWADAEREAERRRSHGQWYAQAVPRGPCVVPILAPGRGRAGWLRFPVLLREGWEEVADPAAARRLGIAPGYPRPLAELPALRAHLVPWCLGARWPGAERLARSLITLPTHSLVTSTERVEIIRWLERYATGARSRSRS